MTVFDRIKDYNQEEMVEFLYNFAGEVIEHFSNFHLPNKISIKELLEKEL